MKRTRLSLALLAVMVGGALTVVASLRFAPPAREPAKDAQTARASEGERNEAVAPESGEASAAAAEPTQEDCEAAVGKARALAESLPADHLSRYFAERHLHQSMVEAGNREFDDCLYWAAVAMDEVREQRHIAGEKIHVMRPDETPREQPNQQKPPEKRRLHEKSRH